LLDLSWMMAWWRWWGIRPFSISPTPPTRRYYRVPAHRHGPGKGLAIIHPAYNKRRVPVGPAGFGEFCDEVRPLACLYIPERWQQVGEGAAVQIEPLSQAQAVVDLMRYSFTPRLVQAAGLQPQRLDFFARLVKQIPVRRLIYPNGYQHLPRVRDAILEDLARL
jgi:hypothetical protein